MPDGPLGAGNFARAQDGLKTTDERLIRRARWATAEAVHPLQVAILRDADLLLRDPKLNEGARAFLEDIISGAEKLIAQGTSNIEIDSEVIIISYVIRRLLQASEFTEDELTRRTLESMKSHVEELKKLKVKRAE